MPDDLFINHNLLHSRDPSKARVSVESVLCRHLLRVSGNRDRLNFIHRGANLGALSFNFISYGADVEVSVNDINRSEYIIVIPLSGEAVFTNRKHEYDLRCGSLVVLDPLSPFKFEMQPEHSHLAIRIPRQKMNAYFSDLAKDTGDLHFEYRSRPYRSHEVSGSLLSFVNYICEELDRPGSMVDRSAVSLSIENTLLTLLNSNLVKPSSNFPSEITTLSIPDQYVNRAEQFMEQNLTEQIQADDIVSAVGVPARTLYYAYKKKYTVGPMSWLKVRRLQQARMDLLDPSQKDVSITDIAMRYHQSHIGRFSRAYRNEFGELPSDTRKRTK